MRTRLFSLILLLTLVNGCSDDTPQAEAGQQASHLSCAALQDITPYCEFKNPEDLVIVPGGQQLLVSEMGEFLTDNPGQLSLFDIASGARQPINIDWLNPGQQWGAPGCAAPDAELFSPHGIDLTTRADGQTQLLVVNHGGREAVEFFALTGAANQWQLVWKGCAIPPEDPFINDVAGLNDGGILVTHMWNKSMPFEEVVAKLTAGEFIGWVWHWDPHRGFNKLPGSSELMPNGITVSHDSQKAFVNIYMGNKTIKLDIASGEKEGEFAVQQPDNITIDEAGNLWVASHKHDPINQSCAEVLEGPCLLPFDIVRADSKTMTSEVVLHHAGAPMGFATVALKVGDKIFMGSAHGDRIASYSLRH